MAKYILDRFCESAGRKMYYTANANNGCGYRLSHGMRTAYAMQKYAQPGRWPNQAVSETLDDFILRIDSAGD